MIKFGHTGTVDPGGLGQPQLCPKILHNCRDYNFKVQVVSDFSSNSLMLHYFVCFEFLEDTQYPHW